ncbi:MAG: methylornithine synthase PylB [Desulfobacterales bacterium]|jgi:methylornithine synthase
MKEKRQKFEDILSRALRKEQLSADDIVILLSLNNPDQINKLFATAKSLRQHHFGDKIFIYGFIYTSTYCRNDCNFCFFRRSNPESRRYRKAKPEIVSAARHLADSGVHLIDLTMGEDPALFNGSGAGFDRLIDLADSVRQATGLPIMVSPGVISPSVLSRLVKSGACWYACYQETHNRSLFRQLRPGQSYAQRLEAKRHAHNSGLLIEEGLLCGVGETARDIARSIAVMQALNADQVRVMNFVPQPGTPMAERTPPDPRMEALVIAVMRLAFPDRLIPASLDVDGLAGLKKRLDAGANVVTSVIPKSQGFAGVAQHSLDIESGRRTKTAVLKVLDTAGLKPATSRAYFSWVAERQKKVAASNSRGKIAC